MTVLRTSQTGSQDDRSQEVHAASLPQRHLKRKSEPHVWRILVDSRADAGAQRHALRELVQKPDLHHVRRLPALKLLAAEEVKDQDGLVVELAAVADHVLVAVLALAGAGDAVVVPADVQVDSVFRRLLGDL